MTDWLDIFSGAAGVFVGALVIFALIRGKQ
jgi:hypothetical protein